MYYEDKFNNLRGNIRGTWKFINYIYSTGEHNHSKRTSIKEIVSEAKTIKDPFEINQNSIFCHFF